MSSPKMLLKQENFSANQEMIRKNGGKVLKELQKLMVGLKGDKVTFWLNF